MRRAAGASQGGAESLGSQRTRLSFTRPFPAAKVSFQSRNTASSSISVAMSRSSLYSTPLRRRTNTSPVAHAERRRNETNQPGTDQSSFRVALGLGGAEAGGGRCLGEMGHRGEPAHAVASSSRGMTSSLTRSALKVARRLGAPPAPPSAGSSSASAASTSVLLTRPQAGISSSASACGQWRPDPVRAALEEGPSRGGTRGGQI